jgi:hypothetical protein
LLIPQFPGRCVQGFGGCKSIMKKEVLLVLATFAQPSLAQASAELAQSPFAAEQTNTDEELVTGAEMAKPQVVPKLTVVTLEILADLSSDQSKSLEGFPLRLAQPIELNGTTLIPAGALGKGEVVHAKKAGGGGSPGELVIAARYLEIGGRQLPLRSLRLAAVGESKINSVNTLNTAAAATVPVAAIVGFLIKGGETSVASGTLVEAKVAQDFEVPAYPVADVQPESGSGKTEEEADNEGKIDDEKN